MVTVVIGILCGAAIPQYYAIQNSRRQRLMEETIRDVQAAIFKLKTAGADLEESFPSSLDHEPAGQACQNCFSLVLEKGIKDPLWFKASDTEYLFSRNGNHERPADYRESGDFKIIYDRTTETLTAQKITKSSQ